MIVPSEYSPRRITVSDKNEAVFSTLFLEKVPTPFPGNDNDLRASTGNRTNTNRHSIHYHFFRSLFNPAAEYWISVIFFLRTERKTSRNRRILRIYRRKSQVLWEDLKVSNKNKKIVYFWIPNKLSINFFEFNTHECIDRKEKCLQNKSPMQCVCVCGSREG